MNGHHAFGFFERRNLSSIHLVLLQAFHSLCLNSGALTLSLLGEMVDKFIAERLQ